MNTKNNQTAYAFTLVLRGINEITTELEDALFESGCDDAMVHSGNGSIYLTFDRLDTSLEKAVSTAIKDVEKNQKFIDDGIVDKYYKLLKDNNIYLHRWVLTWKIEKNINLHKMIKNKYEKKLN